MSRSPIIGDFILYEVNSDNDAEPCEEQFR